VSTKEFGALKARNRSYAVSNGLSFFQIAFTDTPSDDCAVVFDELVRTIRFE
jgi:hypothetical protein